jgi:hypothetical protein
MALERSNNEPDAPDQEAASLSVGLRPLELPSKTALMEKSSNMKEVEKIALVSITDALEAMRAIPPARNLFRSKKHIAARAESREITSSTLPSSEEIKGNSASTGVP